MRDAVVILMLFATTAFSVVWAMDKKTIPAPEPKTACYQIAKSDNMKDVLLNHCTGETWMAMKVYTGAGSYVYGWFPVNRSDQIQEIAE